MDVYKYLLAHQDKLRKCIEICRKDKDNESEKEFRLILAGFWEPVETIKSALIREGKLPSEPEDDWEGPELVSPSLHQMMLDENA